MQQQIARQQALIDAQQKQFADQKQAIERRTARVEGQGKASKRIVRAPLALSQAAGGSAAVRAKPGRPPAQTAQHWPAPGQTGVKENGPASATVDTSALLTPPALLRNTAAFLAIRAPSPEGRSVLIENSAFSLTLGGQTLNA